MLQIVKEKHQQTHWGINAMVTGLWTQILGVCMTKIVTSVTEKCLICLKILILIQKDCLQELLREETLPGVTGKLKLF